MKKNFLAMTALAAMLFVGCTSSDDLTTRETITKANEAATPINFGTYMGKNGTRAGYVGPITDTELQDGKDGSNTKGFGVFAYNHKNLWSADFSSTTPNFMWNQQVYYSGGWKYEPVKYWPNGEDGNNSVGTPSNSATQDVIYGKYLSFFAYAPYVNPNNNGIFSSSETSGITALSANNALGHPTVTYTLAAGFSQVDLLWGTRSYASASDLYNLSDGTETTPSKVGDYYYNSDLTKQKASETIDFVFKHALTKIGGSDAMKIVLDLDGNGNGETGATTITKDKTTLVTVNKITVQNSAAKLTRTGTFDLANGTWAATNESSTQGQHLNLEFNLSGTGSTVGVTYIALNADIAEPSTKPTWSTDKWTYTGADASDTGVLTTAKNVYSSTGNPFYLIPGTQDQELTVSVDYTVRTYDTKLAVPDGETEACSKVQQVINNTVTLPTSLVKPNKKITLVLHLGLTSVKFTAEVDNWEAVEGASAREVWLPSNVIGS